MDTIAAAVGAERPDSQPLRLAFGVVTSTAPFQVTIDGSTVAATVKRMASYSAPVIGDYVAVLVAGNDRLVVGKVT
jgi:hypothetical protein